MSEEIKSPARQYFIVLTNARIEVTREELFNSIKHYRKDSLALIAQYKKAEEDGYGTLEVTYPGIGLQAYVADMYKGGRWASGDSAQEKEGRLKDNSPRPLTILGNILND